MTNTEAYELLKAKLAELANRAKSGIGRGTVLRDNPPEGLGYTDQGLSDLAQVLNTAFANAGAPLGPPLTPAAVRGTKTVGELIDTIRTRI